MQLESPCDYCAKIIFVGKCSCIKTIEGSSGVGKSNICSRLTRNSFNLQTKSTVGVDFGSREVVVDDSVIRL